MEKVEQTNIEKENCQNNLGIYISTISIDNEGGLWVDRKNRGN
jgi:hypothetical protein